MAQLTCSSTTVTNGIQLGQNLPGVGSLAGTPRNMGLGAIGSPGILFKRKFRWTMRIDYCINAGGGSTTFCTVPEEFVKIGARPQLDIEETEINWLHGKFWIPGKGTWQTMTVTYYDVIAGPASVQTTNSDGSGNVINPQSLFNWLASVYDFTNPTTLYMGGATQDYQGQGQILLYDGCGNTLEQWVLGNMWPQSVNFGELDMSSSDECTVELTLRYSNVQYYTPCGGTIQRCGCTPCSSLPALPAQAW